jgi:hypothetical protein
MPKLTVPTLTLAEAAAALPPIDGQDGFHGATVRVWVLQGFRLPDGRVVRLGASKKGGGWRIRMESLNRFLRELRAAGVPIGGHTAEGGAAARSRPVRSGALAVSKALVRGRRPGRREA